MRKASAQRLALLVLGLVCALVLGVASASAQTSRTWVQDFEQSTAGWFDNPPGTIHRVPSGYVSPSSYGSGIQSAHGRWHARLRDSGCGAVRFTTTCFGPFTRWGKPTGFNPTFPDGGYMTEVDIYLDVAWATGKVDYRFDWASAINNSAGSHKRDFVFNVGTENPAVGAPLPGFYINASTNSTRSGAFPQNPCPHPAYPPNYCRTPVRISQSGWYTFRHRFFVRHHEGTDYLAVEFTVLRHDGVVMANWWLSATAPADNDNMATVGGDRYGWFVINEINDLAIDCSNLRPPALGHPPLGRRCEFDDDDDRRDDDDDHDDDDKRDDKDDDDDNDGRHDDDDDDDDNDDLDDREDRDDDNDGIEDDFDSRSTNELQLSSFDTLEAGQERTYDLAVDASTLLVVATAEVAGAALDSLSQPLSVEIYDPTGKLVAAAPPVLGRMVATALPTLPGSYQVKVRNSGSASVQYGTRRIVRTGSVLP